MDSSVRGSFVRVALAAVVATAAAVTGAPAQPALSVAAEECRCPGITGAFVVLLKSDRGMLVLSGAPFEGGYRLGAASGGAVAARPPGSSTWTIDAVSAAGGAGELFGNVYPFSGEGVDGCVAADKRRWSSEGDLVTYLRYLVEDVYMALPAGERRRTPAFYLGDREVRLRLERPGFASFSLAGKEGASLALRYPDLEGMLVLVPFILDPQAGRVAVRVLLAEGPMWESAPKRQLAFVVGDRGTPGVVETPPLVIRVTGVGKKD